ncbi:MAG: YicC/YloC family endoribonuclease [Bacteroidales bacterium]
MIRSMTGFGKSECDLADKKITIELRSLNSRQLDINLKIPSIYRDKETILRNEIALHLNRGKVDLTIHFDQTSAGFMSRINTPVVTKYAKQLQETGRELGMKEYDPLEMLKMAMRLPDTITNEKTEADENEWTLVFSSFLTALEQINKFRIQEGDAMHADLVNRINTIEQLLSDVDQFETSRIEIIRNRLQQNLNEFFSNNSVDRNRFEQEIIFYLEKLDITEEKVRLKNHIEYFRETLKSEEPGGKKLGFISQEMGREINTIGSKANDFNIQKIVVQMKDELEKIKEQSLNLL